MFLSLRPRPLGFQPRLPEERGRVRQRDGQAEVSRYSEEALPKDEETSRAATQTQPSLFVSRQSPGKRRQRGRG